MVSGGRRGGWIAAADPNDWNGQILPWGLHQGGSRALIDPQIDNRRIGLSLTSVESIPSLTHGHHPGTGSFQLRPKFGNVRIHGP